jgi:phosphoribosylanthranilate isomerase
VNVEAKICGLVRPEDARHADRAGADYLGVVFGPSPRRRTEEQARRIWQGTAGRRVGVFVDADEDELLRLARSSELAVVQLHGSEEPEVCRRIREQGAWATWKAVRARDDQSLRDTLARYADAVDGILVEGWSARGHGGLGARFDWSLAAEWRGDWPEGVQLILAGGLDPENVGEAIRVVRPDVVDVSSGVERAIGIKDPDAVRAFVAAAKAQRRPTNVARDDDP